MDGACNTAEPTDAPLYPGGRGIKRVLSRGSRQGFSSIMIDGDRLDWMRTEQRLDVGSYEQNFTGCVPSGHSILRMAPLVT